MLSSYAQGRGQLCVQSMAGAQAMSVQLVRGKLRCSDEATDGWGVRCARKIVRWNRVGDWPKSAKADFAQRCVPHLFLFCKPPKKSQLCR